MVFMRPDGEARPPAGGALYAHAGRGGGVSRAASFVQFSAGEKGDAGRFLALCLAKSRAPGAGTRRPAREDCPLFTPQSVW